MMKKYYLLKPECGLGTKALEDITNLLAEYSEADVIETKEVANADYILTPIVSGLDTSSQTAISYGFTDTGRVYFYRERQE